MAIGSLLKFLPDIGGVIGEIGGILDDLITTDEERAEANVKLLTLQAEITRLMIEAESELAEKQTQIILAETQGQNWLQRNWRPALMVNFAALVNYSIITGTSIPDWIGYLLVSGVTGYVLGRSGENMMKTWTLGGQNPIVGSRDKDRQQDAELVEIPQEDGRILRVRITPQEGSA